MNVDTLEFLKKKKKDKQITYNGYKKSQILSMLQQELMKGNINKCCISRELIYLALLPLC